MACFITGTDSPKVQSVNQYKDDSQFQYSVSRKKNEEHAIRYIQSRDFHHTHLKARKAQQTSVLQHFPGICEPIGGQRLKMGANELLPKFLKPSIK